MTPGAPGPPTTLGLVNPLAKPNLPAVFNMALAQTATNTTPTICTEPGSGLAGSAIGRPRLFFRADNSMAEPGVAGCTSGSHFVAGGFYGATNVDKFLQARGCARQRLRISRQRMTTAAAMCALEGFSCRHDDWIHPGVASVRAVGTGAGVVPYRKDRNFSRTAYRHDQYRTLAPPCPLAQVVRQTCARWLVDFHLRRALSASSAERALVPSLHARPPQVSSTRRALLLR